jgi:hypothetical protein
MPRQDKGLTSMQTLFALRKKGGESLNENQEARRRIISSAGFFVALMRRDCGRIVVVTFF